MLCGLTVHQMYVCLCECVQLHPVMHKGAVAHGVSIFPNIFVVASLCSFICLQAVYQLSGAVCKATWNGYPS